MFLLEIEQTRIVKEANNFEDNLKRKIFSEKNNIPTKLGVALSVAQ